MNNLKILHLSNANPKNGGGIHEVVSNFYKYQKQLQHHPSILYPGHHLETDSMKLDKNIRGLPEYSIGRLKILKELFKAVSNDISSFDIIHQHGVWTPMSFYAQKIRSKSKLKLVIQPHGLLEPFRLNISKYKKKLAYQLYEKSNLSNASAIIACSEDEAYNLKKMFPKNDVAIIHNGVSSDFYNTDSKKYNYQRNKKRILFLSQIIPIKGLERIFRVINDIGIESFSEWEFLIAGYGDDIYINSLKTLAAKFKLDSLVTFVGTKLGKEKIEIFDNSDVFILPTYNENFGIVVPEALARGIPVITTRGTPWSELNEYNCGWWVNNTDEGLKNSLIEILSCSSIKLKTMGQNGKKLVKEKYLWDKTTPLTIELYTWLITGGSKPDIIV